jgi:phosphoribosyl 1,2-cyclic phosphodiesterase
MSAQFRLRLKFHGVRGSIPTPVPANLGFGGNTTCLHVSVPGGGSIIIDAGTGLRQLGLEMIGTDPQPLSMHFLLTHFHWDHIQGIPFFAPLYSPKTSVTFYSGRKPEEARDVLEGQMSSPYFPVNFDLLAARREFVHATERPFHCNDVCVQTFPLNHPQGAFGYRLERDGAVIVHASDLEHGDAKLDRVLLDFAHGADVLVYDAQYTPEEYGAKKGWGHSTWLEATKVAKAAGVNRLVLIHHDPSHNDQALREIEQQARQEFPNTEAAREGAFIDV